MKNFLVMTALLASQSSFAFSESGTFESSLFQECEVKENSQADAGAPSLAAKLDCKEPKKPAETNIALDLGNQTGIHEISVMVGQNSFKNRFYSLSLLEDFEFSRGTELGGLEFNLREGVNKNSGQVLIPYIAEFKKGSENFAIAGYFKMAAGGNFESLNQPIYKYIEAQAAVGAKVKIWRLSGVTELRRSAQGYNSIMFGGSVDVRNRY